MLKILFSISLFIFFTEHSVAGEVGHDCNFVLFPGNVSAIGDSRAQLFAHDSREPINNAKVSAKTILKNSPVTVSDRAWGGSTTKDWVEKIYSCRNAPLGYFVSDKIFMSLGGNDLLAIHKETYGAKDSYSPFLANESFTALSDAMRSSSFAEEQGRRDSVLQSSARNLDELQQKFLDEEVHGVINNFEPSTGLYYGFWNTATRVNEDEVARNAEYIIDKILAYDPNRKIILSVANPVCRQDSWYFSSDPGFIAAREKYGELTSSFESYRLKIRKRVYPKLAKVYKTRILLLDQYKQFKRNCEFSDHSLYFFDGIHFSEAGDDVWGKGLAYFMGIARWFALDDSFINSFLFPEPEAIMASLTLDLRAVDEDVEFDRIMNARLQATPRGYFKDYPGNLDERRLISIKNDADEAFFVKGLVLEHFLNNESGLTGRFGYPYTDEFDTNTGTINNSDFECGRIYFNRLGGGTTSVFKPDQNPNESPYKEFCQKKQTEEHP